MNSGIYSIVNRVNGKRYIGSSIRLQQRWLEHRNSLRRNGHVNKHLQSAWNKYGERAFQFKVLIYCPRDMIAHYEQTFLDKWKPEYNKNPCAHRPPSTKGKKFGKRPQEVIEKISRAKIGKKHSAETKRKLSHAHTGKKRSAEHKRNLGLAGLGRQHSDETKSKMSQSKKGHPVTNETRQKIRLALQGKKASPEARQKMSLAKTGKKHSAETKRKLSLARKAMARG